MSHTTEVKLTTSSGVRLSFVYGARNLAEYANVAPNETLKLTGEDAVNFAVRPIFLQHFKREDVALIKALIASEQAWEDDVAPEQLMITYVGYSDGHVPYEYFVLEISHHT